MTRNSLVCKLEVRALSTRQAYWRKLLDELENSPELNVRVDDHGQQVQLEYEAFEKRSSKAVVLHGHIGALKARRGWSWQVCRWLRSDAGLGGRCPTHTPPLCDGKRVALRWRGL